MKQVRVTAVNGRKVQANGKWLTAIGNNSLVVGDLVWTDGKCVYGHQSASGGGSAVMSAAMSGIPFLVSAYTDGEYSPRYMYYRNGKTGDFGQGKPNRKMVNRGNHMAFFEDVAFGALDADMDNQGNAYSLHARQIYMDWEAYPAIDFIQGEIVVKKNGEIISEENIEPFIYPIISEAMSIAAVSLDRHTSGDDHIDELTVTEFFSMFWNGHIDENGNYQLLTYVSLTAEREDSAMHWDGRDGYRVGYVGYCELTKWFMFDGKNVTEWSQRTDRGCYAFSYGWYPIIHDDWRVTDERYAPDYSVKVMLGDGIYATVGNVREFCNRWAYRDICDLKFYDANDEFLCSVVGNPGRRLSVCPLGSGKFLILSVTDLLLWDNGEITKIATNLSNFRIRPMPNLRKFKKVGGL